MPTPNVYFKVLLALVVCAAFFLGGLYVGHLRLVAYQERITAEGKVQEQKNKDLIVQQQLITKQVQNDYENKLARIKSYYNGLHYPSSSKLSSFGTTASSLNGTPSDAQFAEKCAATTLQLESLQDFINQQVGLK
jgi:hypothetical protein